MRTCYIMIGLPGSGKSTNARLIKSYHKLLNHRVEIFSTDDHFMVDEEYKFDPSKLSEYHIQNFRNFKDFLYSGGNVAIVDNTNLQKWQWERYVNCAHLKGYVTHFVPSLEWQVQTCYDRQTHGVPLEHIQRMKDGMDGDTISIINQYLNDRKVCYESQPSKPQGVAVQHEGVLSCYN